MNIFDSYKIMGVHPGVTDLEIKKRHRILSAATHPDRAVGKEDEFHDIQVAYRQIRTAADRALHKTRMQGFGEDCIPCKGRGYLIAKKSFHDPGLRTGCEECGFNGVIPRVR